MLDLQAIFGDESKTAVAVDVACEAPTIDLANANQVRQATPDRLEGDPLFPTDVMEALRAADARWADDPDTGKTDEAIEVIVPPAPCPKCGTAGDIDGDIETNLPGWIEQTDAAGDWTITHPDHVDDQIIEMPDPYPDCEGVSFWWDFRGNRHCEECQPPTIGRRLRELAQRLKLNAQNHSYRTQSDDRDQSVVR